jgi:dolichyl-phosphate beta-glucosyltransferase
MVPDGSPSLSVVMPAYNEERRLDSGLSRILEFLGRRDASFEVIVVDDGSRDSTRQIAERHAAADPRVRAVGLPGNRGKGAAVALGMMSARAEWILCTDVDLSTPIEELERLEAFRGSADVIVASRDVPRSVLQARQPLRRENLGRAFNYAVRLAALYGIRDTQCGFKLWSRKAARAVFPRMRLRRFAFDVEALWLCRKLGFRIREVGVRWRHDADSRVRLLRDGLRMGADLMKILFWRIHGK